MLSSSAEAALLKTLEESPEHVVFVLATTDPLKVAPTIRSRTQHYEFTLYTVDEILGHLVDVARQGRRGRVDPTRSRSSLGPPRGRCATRCRCSTRRSRTARSTSSRCRSSSAGRRSPGASRLLQSVIDEDVAGALVGLGELLDHGHEPRRLTEDLLATSRDAFLLTSAKGRVRVDVPEDDMASLAALGRSRGSRAARADTRDARAGGGRHAGRRRGRSAPGARDRARAPGAPRRRAATPGPGRTRRPPRARRTRGERRRRRTGPRRGLRRAREGRFGVFASRLRSLVVGVEGRPRRESRARAPETAEPEPPAPEPAPAAVAPVDDGTPIELDDVILAWAAILPTFPPVTKAAAQEAQPIAIDGNVVTFGVPKNLFEATKKRFQDQADAIREGTHRATRPSAPIQDGARRRLRFADAVDVGFVIGFAVVGGHERRRAAAARRRGDRSQRAHRHGARRCGGRFSGSPDFAVRRDRRRRASPRLRIPWPTNSSR